MKFKDLVKAMGAIEDERMISNEVIFNALKEGIEKAFRKHVGCPDAVVRIDIDNKDEVRIYQVKTVVEEVDDDEIEIALEDAQEKNPNLKIGDTVEEEVYITEFGRAEVTLVKNIMLQKIKEATKQVIYDEYIDKVNDMVTGTVETVEEKFVLVNLGKTLALMSKNDQIPNERYTDGQRLKVIISEVKKESKSAQIHVSRSSPMLVKRLFELSVPEIYDGTVEIKAIAREANERTKMAVYSKNPNVDAIGACIGPRGNRVVNVIEEITQKNNSSAHENIDIVEWNPDFIEYVKNVMKPANIIAVVPEEDNNNLLIVVDDKDLSVAIGKKGINARLASKLLDRKIEIKSLSAVESEGIDYQGKMAEFQAKELEKRYAEELRKAKEDEEKQQAEREKLKEELLKQQAAAEEIYEPEFDKDDSGRTYDSYDEIDFVENNSHNTDENEAVTLENKETAQQNQVSTESEPEKEKVDEETVTETKETVKRRKPKLTVKASDYVSKYEELADAKKTEKVQVAKKRRSNNKEDQEEKEIKEKIEALKKQDYEIKPEYTEEELAEFENPEEEHWYDDDNVDYDEYDEFYDK